MGKLIGTPVKFLVGEPVVLKNNGSSTGKLIGGEGEELTDIHWVSNEVITTLLCILFDLLFQKFFDVHSLRIFPLGQLEKYNKAQCGHTEKIGVNTGLDQSESTCHKKES